MFRKGLVVPSKPNRHFLKIIGNNGHLFGEFFGDKNSLFSPSFFALRDAPFSRNKKNNFAEENAGLSQPYFFLFNKI